ncbi:MAG: HD domain-containing protein [Armatimonadetes bacterium]|nr:HD domain-containing protein [Armatimonadota bacterium]
MEANFWSSSAFIASAAATLAAGGYSYAHLPYQMRKAYRQSLLTLASAVETKDTGAAGHGKRVAEHVVATAKEMRIPRKQMERMEYAAFLQDIGNVRVPHTILNRPENLTPAEFEIVKTHTAVGADMVEQVKFLRDISPIIRHHHEAWDGGGYPDGLKGDEIPLGARIIAVCTAFDAMTHAKAYRPAMDEEDVVRTIRAAAGRKYDPAVADAFLRSLKKRRREEESHS